MKSVSKHLLMFALLFIAGWTSAAGQPRSSSEPFRLLLVDNISHYTTVGEVNNYDNRFRLQNVSLTAADLRVGENIFAFYRTAANGTSHVFAELVLQTTSLDAPLTVTPSIRYYDENGDLTSAGGNTTLNYTSKTYAAGDTLDLYGVINYVNDVFSESVVGNLHPDAYTYYVTFNEEEPVTYNVGDVLGSLDLSTLASGNNTLTSPWGGVLNKSAAGSYATIDINQSITFRVPWGITNESVTVAITTHSSSQGAGTFIINGTPYQAKRNTTNYFEVANVSSGDLITISGGSNAASPRISKTSTIYIYYGNYNGN
ncbi:MAG: hypothetical protein IJG42_04765 [Muribaculaceae bacterium]|nr:hypothetical protein [Muribaculaceae bacterium]